MRGSRSSNSASDWRPPDLNPLTARHSFAMLQTVQKGKDAIGRFVAGGGLNIRWSHFCKDLLLKSKIGIEVDLRSFHGLMSKPKCDHRAIDPSLKQFHGHRVAQHVRRHFFAKQGRAGLGSGHNVFSKDVSHAITAETT